MKFLQNFIRLEASGGIVLGLAALLALFLANSPLQTHYQNLLGFSLTWGPFHLSLLHAINDGLMTIFFFLVSLEIKREYIQGELNSRSKALLPLCAAIGGMLVPALLYLIVNYKYPAFAAGWAIPMATDIAFSLGVLSLLSKKIPVSLKVFLTALAIIDDLGAIIVIAIFYTQQIEWLYLCFALLCFISLIFLNYHRIQSIFPYLLLGFGLWVFILYSGVHATIAGVLLGLTIPLITKHKNQPSLLHRLERDLHPWVAYGILPIFAFTNAGLSFSGVYWKTLLHPLSLGILLGLFIGKQIGILGSSWLAVKTKLAKLPQKASWRDIYGIALLCGIGFTMSLFIANLAFVDNKLLSLVRLGVLTGSTLSGLLGYLLFSTKKSSPFPDT